MIVRCLLYDLKCQMFRGAPTDPDPDPDPDTNPPTSDDNDNDVSLFITSSIVLSVKTTMDMGLLVPHQRQ